jgi:hypothetical protein
MTTTYNGDVQRHTAMISYNLWSCGASLSILSFVDTAADKIAFYNVTHDNVGMFSKTKSKFVAG